VKTLIVDLHIHYNWKWILTHPWVIPKHFYNETICFVQRGLYGYSDKDTWGIDGYIASWLPSAIRRLQNGCGYPCGLTRKKWNTILEKIAQGFEAGLKIDEDCLYKGKEFSLLKRRENYGFKLFVKYFHSLWY